MDYLADLLSRSDLQYITEYILSGDSLGTAQPGAAEERLEAAEKELWRLARTVGDEDFAERLYHCCAICEGAYGSYVCNGPFHRNQLLSSVGKVVNLSPSLSNHGTGTPAAQV